MLTRATSVAVGVVSLVLVLGVPSASADSGGGVTCPPTQPVCVITVEGPGTSPSPTPGGGSGNGGTPACVVPNTHEAVPCYDANWGWWSNSQGCYFEAAAPQPPATDPVWNGHYPNGQVYVATCLGGGGIGGGWVWLPNPPDGYGPTVSPATLAQRALDTMRLDGPAIGMAPPAGKAGLVGLPVWMWTTVSPSTWGPTSASASIPGLTVSATAQAVRIVWDMGDGHTVTCDGPGTPFTSSSPSTSSPTCGHTYARSSASMPGAVYPVTATTTWRVSWSGGGQSGVLTVTRVSRTSVHIGELQVLTS